MQVYTMYRYCTLYQNTLYSKLDFIRSVFKTPSQSPQCYFARLSFKFICFKFFAWFCSFGLGMKVVIGLIETQEVFIPIDKLESMSGCSETPSCFSLGGIAQIPVVIKCQNATLSQWLVQSIIHGFHISNPLSNINRCLHSSEAEKQDRKKRTDISCPLGKQRKAFSWMGKGWNAVSSAWYVLWNAHKNKVLSDRRKQVTGDSNAPRSTTSGHSPSLPLNSCGCFETSWSFCWQHLPGLGNFSVWRVTADELNQIPLHSGCLFKGCVGSSRKLQNDQHQGWCSQNEGVTMSGPWTRIQMWIGFLTARVEVDPVFVAA